MSAAQQRHAWLGLVPTGELLLRLPERLGLILFAVTAAVIILEAGGVVTAALLTSQAGSVAASKVGIADLFQDAALAAASEQTLEWQEAVEPSAAERAAQAEAGRRLELDLAQVARDGTAGDRRTAAEILATHNDYRTAVNHLYSLRDAGQIEAAEQFDSQVVDPLSAKLGAVTQSAAALRKRQATEQLTALRSMQATLIRLSPVIVIADVLLIALMWLLQDAHRRAREAKARFLATMSHELRTPLNSVLGFAQMLEMQPSEPLGPRQARYVANIRTSGAALLGLINDILDLARIEAGKVPIRLDPLDLRAVVEDSVQRMAPAAMERGVILETAMTPVPPVALDRGRTIQILCNGLSNAIKFSDSGQQVVVTLARVGKRVEVTIADTGPGIAASDLGRVFREFEQADDTRTRNHQGIGLGLPLSKRLAEAMSAELRLESEHGAGTRFVLSVPVAASDDHQAQPGLDQRDGAPDEALPRARRSEVHERRQQAHGDQRPRSPVHEAAG